VANKKEYSFTRPTFTLFLSVCALIAFLLFILGYQIGRVRGVKQHPGKYTDSAMNTKETGP